MSPRTNPGFGRNPQFLLECIADYSAAAEAAGLPKDVNFITRKLKTLSDGTDSPISNNISAEEVRRQAKDTSTQIFDDWDLLERVLDRHEATIYKRWAKKTKNQRVDILLRA